MDILEEQIKNFSVKLQQLVKNFQHLQKENALLKKENKKLQIDLNNHKIRIDSFQQKADAIKLTSSNISEEEKKDLQKRIGEYLKEIDRCLQIINI